jgi:hypothetical protein
MESAKILNQYKKPCGGFGTFVAMNPILRSYSRGTLESDAPLTAVPITVIVEVAIRPEAYLCAAEEPGYGCGFVSAYKLIPFGMGVSGIPINLCSSVNALPVIEPKSPSAGIFTPCLINAS